MKAPEQVGTLGCILRDESQKNMPLTHEGGSSPLCSSRSWYTPGVRKPAAAVERSMSRVSWRMGPAVLWWESILFSGRCCGGQPPPTFQTWPDGGHAWCRTPHGRHGGRGSPCSAPLPEGLAAGRSKQLHHSLYLGCWRAFLVRALRLQVTLSVRRNRWQKRLWQ